MQGQVGDSSFAAQGTYLFLEKLKLEKYKKHLARWRDVIIVLHPILIWKKEAYVIVPLIFHTALFYLISLSELSFMAMMAIASISYVVAEWAWPTILKVFRCTWNDAKEVAYADACRTMAQIDITLNLYADTVTRFHHFHPAYYAATAVIFWSLMAYLGSFISDQFVVYWLSLVIILLPGMIDRKWL